MARKKKRERINWSKALAHPDDYRLNQQESERRQHARRWDEAANESDGRVCELVGAGSFELGYSHSNQMHQGRVVAWDGRNNRWIPAEPVAPDETPRAVNKLAHAVRQGFTLRPELGIPGGWKTVGRR